MRRSSTSDRKRKWWLVIVAAIGALCLGLALTMPLPSKITPFLALAFVGAAIGGLIGSCNGGLMATTMPDHLRGAAGGWLNVGNLTGGALGAWLTLVMAERYPPIIVGWRWLVLLMTLPSLAVLVGCTSPIASDAPCAEVFVDAVARRHARRARRGQGWTGHAAVRVAGRHRRAPQLLRRPGAATTVPATRMVAFVNGPVNGLVTARRLAHRRLPVRSLEPPRACTSCRARSPRCAGWR